jgi:TolA-binding protein
MSHRRPFFVLTTLLLLALLVFDATAQRRSRRRGNSLSPEDYQAVRLLKKAQDLHTSGSFDQAQKMLENVVDKWPASNVRFQVWLTMGKHAMDRGRWGEAIPSLKKLEHLRMQHVKKQKSAKGEEPEMDDADKELYLESVYLTGICYYQSSQYETAFPVLRRITVQYPNSSWANQSYYYIGMCHFAKKNWSRAIQNLSRVGTLVDPNSPSAEFMEAGRRFYVKIADGDLPMIHRLNQDVHIDVTTKTGDIEKVLAVPLTSAADVYIASAPTEIGLPVPNDGKIQIWGDDEINTLYFDENTQAGEYKVPRKSSTKVISSGGISFTIATYDRPADVAYQADSAYVTLFDSDLDTGPKAQTASVRVVTRYRKIDDKTDEPDVAIAGVDLDQLLAQEEEEKWVIRDEVTLPLSEILRAHDGVAESAVGGAIHSGFFVGSVPLKMAGKDESGDLSDKVLAAYLDDEVVATYTDERHLEGDGPREDSATLQVVGKLTKVPTARQSFIADSVKRARKSIVEATAYLELGKIFADMGLRDGAASKADAGLALVNKVILDRADMPRDLKAAAFKLKWELAITKGDLNTALATCRVFTRLFPESGFADEALMRIGQVQAEKKNYPEAMKIFSSVLGLRTPTSSKAEALYRIAEIKEKQVEERLEKGNQELTTDERSSRMLAAGVPNYKRCAEEYPDSRFAGESLAKMVDYYVLAKDYAAGEDLLERVYLDYPDADFIPRMLLKWVLVSSRRGNLGRAKEKCQELLLEHPQTTYAKKAAQLLEAIKAREARAKSN